MLRSCRSHALRVAALITLAAACANDDPMPPGVPVGGGGAGGTPVFPTGGRGGSDDDGGDPVDAGSDGSTSINPVFALGECVDDTDLPMSSNQFAMPGDFIPTRGYAHWIGHCGDPVLELGLSDGDCPNGDGHELIIQIDGDAITDGTLFIPGGNQLAVERPDQPLRVRYLRPSGLVPAGTWGTCTGVFGELLLSALDVSDDAPLRGEFIFTLAACTSDTLPSTLNVSGQFDLELERALTEVCPP